MRRTWTGTAAAAALTTAFAIPVAFAQESQPGKQGPAGVESGQHRETGPGQTVERAVQPGAQVQTERSQMGAEPAQGQNPREPGKAGKPAMKGESAQTQEPGNRPEPGKIDRGEKTGSQAQQRPAEPQEQGGKAAQVEEPKGQAEKAGRAEQTGPAGSTGQAETGIRNRQGEAQTGQNARPRSGQNVQATGKTNLPHEKAAKVAQTLMASGAPRSSQNINVNVGVGANLPAEVVVNPLPLTIVELVPEFRGYDYFFMGDEIVIVDPATRQVVEIIEDVG